MSMPDCQTLYIVKLLFRNKEEIQTFSGEGKLREFVASGQLKETLTAKRK